MTRSERVAAILASLLAEPGWVSDRRCAPVFGVPSYTIVLDLRLIRVHLDLVEHHMADGELVLTLPGRASPAQPEVPSEIEVEVEKRRARNERRRVRRGRSPAAVERHRQYLDRGSRGYEMAAAGASWHEVSAALAYATAASAYIAVRRYALRTGLRWPLKRGGA